MHFRTVASSVLGHHVYCVPPTQTTNAALIFRCYTTSLSLYGMTMRLQEHYLFLFQVPITAVYKNLDACIRLLISDHQALDVDRSIVNRQLLQCFIDQLSTICSLNHFVDCKLASRTGSIDRVVRMSPRILTRN